MPKVNLRSEKPNETEYTERPFGQTVMFVGIVDDYGIDQIQQFEDIAEPIHWGPMGLRCRMNTHRNARRFMAMIKKRFAPKLPLDLKSNESAISWYKTLKSISVRWVEDGDANDD